MKKISALLLTVIAVMSLSIPVFAGTITQKDALKIALKDAGFSSRQTQILETEKEKNAGITLFGPHRDDMEININGKSSRIFASQGQQRSIVLSLKIAEGEIIKELCGEYPVFLFDDVLSELDEKRKRYIIKGKGEKQILISSCEKDENIFFADRVIKVSQGKYEIEK